MISYPAPPRGCRLGESLCPNLRRARWFPAPTPGRCTVSSAASAPNATVRSRHVDLLLEAQPGGPHGRLERPAPQEGDLGLARRSSSSSSWPATRSARRRSPTSISSRVSPTGPRWRSTRRPAAGRGGPCSSRATSSPSRTRQFRAAVGDVTGRLSKVPYVENVKSPLTGDSAVSADGHAALVDFEIAGDSTEASRPGRSQPRRRRRRPGQASGAGHRAVRRRQRQQGDQRGHQRRPREGGRALPAGHADHPHHHLRHAGGGGRAAADRDHRGAGRPRPGRAPEPAPAGRRQPPGGRPADRPRGRRRLLAVLPAPRARGARRGAQRALRARRPPPRPPGAPC